MGFVSLGNMLTSKIQLGITMPGIFASTTPLAVNCVSDEIRSVQRGMTIGDYVFMHTLSSSWDLSFFVK